jgi:hypothetical protein
VTLRPFLTLVLAVALACAAQAGEVFKTTDSSGRPIYTDRPVQLPAQRLNVQSNSTDVVEVKRRYDAEMQRYAAADAAKATANSTAQKPGEPKTLTAAERAQRCEEARTRYNSMMASHRLYEQKPDETERRYLSAGEVDAARVKAKQAMDESCGQQ